MSALAGGMFALESLQHSAWILRRSGTFQQLASQWAGIACSASIGAGLVLVGSTWGAHQHDQGLAIGLALALSVLHLAVIGGAILQLPGNWKRRAVLLPITAWILPGLLASQGSAGRQLSNLLHANHAALEFTDPTPTAVLGSLGPIIALGMLPILLVSRRPAPLIPQR